MAAGRHGPMAGSRGTAGLRHPNMLSFAARLAHSWGSLCGGPLIVGCRSRISECRLDAGFGSTAPTLRCSMSGPLPSGWSPPWLTWRSAAAGRSQYSNSADVAKLSIREKETSSGREILTCFCSDSVEFVEVEGGVALWKAHKLIDLGESSTAQDSNR